MKNRKTLYVLIPLVIIIWGTIFWKIFWRSTDAIKKVSDDQLTESVIQENREEELTLLLNYSDPFLGELEQIPLTEPIVPKRPHRNEFNRVPMWPEVHYFGVVKNSNSEKVVALLEINRRRYFSRVGDDLDEIRCFFIHNDSIGLEFQNAQRFFMRNGIRNDEYY